MKKLILPIVILLAAAASAFGGSFLKQSANDGAASADASQATSEESAHSKDKKAEKHGKSAKKDAASYMKFSRQFIVPVVKAGTPSSLMILDVNIQVEDSWKESAYALEPKLRDAMLAALLNLASAGDLEKITQSAEALEYAKAQMLTAAQLILGDGAQDILITDIGVQKY